MNCLDWIVRAVVAGGLMRQAQRARDFACFGVHNLIVAAECERAAEGLVS